MGKILLILLTFFPFFGFDEVNINDYYEIDNLRIAFGSYKDDGYLSIFDLQTQEFINEIIYDEGFLEEFIYLAEVSNNNFIIVCKRSIYLGEEKMFHDFILLKYNFMGEVIDAKTLDNTYTNFYNHHQHLVLEENGNYTYINQNLEISNELDLNQNYLGNYYLQYQGEAFINGEYVNEIALNYPGYYEIAIFDGDYRYSFSITLEPDIIIEGNFIDKGYYGEIKVYSFGELYLNNILYESGKTIKTPGVYILTVNGVNGYNKEIEFSLYPYIYYYNGIDSFILSEDKLIEEPIRLFSSINPLYLNDQIYNNELINQPGKYNLSYEQNGIKDSIEFRIYPKVEGVEAGESYKSLNIYIFGEAYINGKIYQGQVELSEPGKYNLELYFDNELYKSINFEIINNENSYNNYSYIKYGFIILLGIGGLLFFWKK